MFIDSTQILKAQTVESVRVHTKRHIMSVRCVLSYRYRYRYR